MISVRIAIFHHFLPIFLAIFFNKMLIIIFCVVLKKGIRRRRMKKIFFCNCREEKTTHTEKNVVKGIYLIFFGENWNVCKIKRG